MNILFLSYWAAADGLSSATVFPHLRILVEMPSIKKIIYCSIERNRSNKDIPHLHLDERIQHVPLYTGTTYLDKILDFLILPKKLARLVREHHVDMLICRGAPAGSLGHMVNQAMKTPYVVESFEPHALYMLQAGIWKRSGLKFWAQSIWEKRQLQTASSIIVVSRSYMNELINTGVDSTRLAVAPCAVDLQKFGLRSDSRAQIRARLSFPHSSIVGIYVGKFGGMYYEDEAFEIFARAYAAISNFRLLVLTPDQSKMVTERLATVGIPSTHIHVTSAPHHEVPDFLSAADFAFALHKPSPSMKALSPVKIGEYWANGLPVLLPEGIGDDSEIVESEGGGFTFSLQHAGSLVAALKRVEELVRQKDRQELAQSICKLAHKYRNFDHIRAAYEKVLFHR